MGIYRWRSAAALLAVVSGCASAPSPVSSAANAGPATQPSAADVWFEDLREPIALTDKDAESLLRYMGDRLRGADKTTASLPPALRQDAQPRIVFLSVSDGLHSARVAAGAGVGLAQAVEKAMSHFTHPRAAGPRPKWIKLDLVQPAGALERSDPERPLTLEPSLYGLAWSRNSGVALLPEELTAHGLVDGRQRLQPENIRAYLRGRGENWAAWLLASREDKVWRFSTLGFFSDGREVIRLYRGHRTFPELTRQELLAGAKRGAEYLLRALREDGSFVYQYQADTGRASEEYNILRHCGTAYALLEVYEATRDRRLLAAAEKAIGYLLGCVRPGLKDEQATACVVERGRAKLGGNALAVLVLVKHSQLTGNRRHLPLVIRLTRWMQSAQAENGDFLIHQQAYPGGRVSDFVSGYYPGEAMLALVRAHAIDPKGGWLDAAERAAHHLINVRDRERPAPDQWQLYALNELYRLRPKEIYLGQAMRMAEAIVSAQRRSHEYPDWVGSFLDPPRSTPTAVRMEGLCAAHSLARDFGRPDQAEKILQAIRFGSAFQLQTQIGPESAMYLRDPPQALGGIRRSLTSYDVRIDYVQHTVSSLLGLYRILGR